MSDDYNDAPGCASIPILFFNLIATPNWVQPVVQAFRSSRKGLGDIGTGHPIDDAIFIVHSSDWSKAMVVLEDEGIIKTDVFEPIRYAIGLVDDFIRPIWPFGWSHSVRVPANKVDVVTSGWDRWEVRYR